MKDKLDQFVDNPSLLEWLEPEILKKENLMRLPTEFVTAKPFPHIYLDDLLIEDKLIMVTQALSEQNFDFKQSDLFSFHQTLDFEFIESPILSSFRNFLQSEAFIGFMEFITEIPLSTEIDCLGNIYADMDHLLCHDDELLERKIAFIFYLTDMDKTTGGTFHLFNTKKGEPLEIVKSIIPTQNRFFFFKVTRTSFHEVGEVVGEDVYRVSISGWFKND